MPKRGAASVRLLCDAGAAIGESPLWQHGRVLWTDPVGIKMVVGAVILSGGPR